MSQAQLAVMKSQWQRKQQLKNQTVYGALIIK